MSQDITDLHAEEDRLKSAYFRSISKMRRNPSGGRNGGRPKTAPRCLCGKYTQAGLARRPNHKCGYHGPLPDELRDEKTG